MSEGFFLDNDVVIKACSYNAEQPLIDVTSPDGLAPAILELARFTCRTRLVRSRRLVNQDAAIASFETLLTKVRCLEPSEEEIQFAAELERLAAAANLSFDTGESQIVAMLVRRRGLAFLTGDKRAVAALGVILPDMKRKVACLEQVVSSILTAFGLEPLRSTVCRENPTDIAISNCFQCATPDVTLSQALAALKSYSNNLRSSTGEILLDTDDLSGAIVS